MGGLIASIVFSSIGVIIALLKLAWSVSGNFSELNTKVDGLTKSVDRLDGHVGVLADREDEQDRRITALEVKAGAA